MIRIYGSMLCKDCVSFLGKLDQQSVAYTFLDITTDLQNMKAFLPYRDDPVFNSVKAAGNIGIPCIVEEDGTVSLSTEKYVSQA